MPIPAVTPYHVAELLETHLPALRPAQRRGLALWLEGLLAAESGCERAILTALEPLGLPEHATRAKLREWLYDGADRATPCATTLDVETCFAPLLGWVVSWWQGAALPLAIDATSLRDRTVVLRLSVLYRDSAIPVAWAVFPDKGKGKGTWMPALRRLLALLAPAVPATMLVLVMTDGGLWSPALWSQIRAVGWHPLMRIRPDATFAPTGHKRGRARELAPGPGSAWVGAGVAFKDRAKRLDATLLVVWDEGQEAPWLLLSDVAPEAVDVSWYGLRVWIELGFRSLKSFGWDWERTRRTDPARIARHWLVLAIGTLLNLAVGTRVEDAEWLGVPPANLRAPRACAKPRPRRTAVFARGLAWVHTQVLRGRHLWRRLWLRPEPWPEPSPGLRITVVPTPMEGAHA